VEGIQYRKNRLNPDSLYLQLQEASMCIKFYQPIFTLFLCLAAWMSGCKPMEDRSTAEAPALEMANPASVYCQGLGFVEDTRENDLGEHSVCVFPDGSVCDSWDFLAGRCGQEFSYCQQQGFELQSDEDQNIANCVFLSGASCSEFLFFQGECSPED